LAQDTRETVWYDAHKLRGRIYLNVFAFWLSAPLSSMGAIEKRWFIKLRLLRYVSQA